jgi:phosphoglycerate dehydrogenase-like enzyme
MYNVEEIAMILPQCDYIVNILPLTDNTYHLIGENEFSKMNRDAIYINVGRGGTTDTKALITALEQGYIAAAGLDVFEEEPLSRDSVLWQMEQVIITAHNAGMTPGYVDKVMEILSDNIGSYLQSGAPRRNVVDLELGY